MKEKSLIVESKKPWNKIIIWISFLELAILYMADKTPIVEILQIVVLIGGITSYKQIKKLGERGKWLSIICLILSGLATLAFLVSMLTVALSSK